MFRMLNNAQRAPLPYIAKIIKNHEQSMPTDLSYDAWNRELIQVLHDHNWKKSDYVRALKAHERERARLKKILRQPTVYCFKR